jgi:hypothetical protein
MPQFEIVSEFKMMATSLRRRCLVSVNKAKKQTLVGVTGSISVLLWLTSCQVTETDLIMC